MSRWLTLLCVQLLLAISVTFENQLILVPLALAPVAILEPRAFRMLLRWRLLLFIALMVGGVPVLLGDRSAVFMGIPYAPEYVQATVVMVERGLIILMALKLFTTRLSLEEITRQLGRTRFRQFGEAFGLAMELLPQMRAMATESYHEYRSQRRGRNPIRHILSWTAELIARAVVRAESYSYKKGRTG